VCVDLCAVFHLIVVLFFCVMCVICVLCLIVVRLPSGKNPFAIKINNNNNNKMSARLGFRFFFQNVRTLVRLSQHRALGNIQIYI
jgi:hypothetical protein